MINLNSIPQISTMIGGLRTQLAEQSLPQYNLIKHDENIYELELAAMGFDKDELAVYLKNNTTLVITGEKKEKDNSSIFTPDYEYLHNKLFTNTFTREWTVRPGLRVGKVSLKNGILSIMLEAESKDVSDVNYIKLSIE